MGPDGPSRRLRGTLLSALAALILVAAVETRHPSERVVAVTPAVPFSTSSAVRGRAPAPPSVVAPNATGPRASGDGCGLSLTPSAPMAPVGHCSVIEIGDSLGNDLGWGLARHLDPASGLELHQLDRSATGLANTAFYDWASAFPTALAQYHPDLVLVCLGGNDEQGFETGGTVVSFGTSAWRVAYSARVRQLVVEATAVGAEVVWVGLPIMRDPSYRAGVLELDAVYERVVNGTPGATFVPTWSLFADPSGAYRSEGIVDGSRAALRQPDGIHLSYTGEDVIATYVIRAIASAAHVGLAPVAPAEITGWA